MRKVPIGIIVGQQRDCCTGWMQRRLDGSFLRCGVVTCLGALLSARPRIRLRLGWTETSCIQQQGHQSLGPLPTQLGLGAETSHITLDRVNQQVGAVSEATTADCALKLDESILSPVRSTQHLGWQTDRAEIGWDILQCQLSKSTTQHLGFDQHTYQHQMTKTCKEYDSTS